MRLLAHVAVGIFSLAMLACRPVITDRLAYLLSKVDSLTGHHELVTYYLCTQNMSVCRLTTILWATSSILWQMREWILCHLEHLQRGLHVLLIILLFGRTDYTLEQPGCQCCCLCNKKQGYDSRPGTDPSKVLPCGILK